MRLSLSLVTFSIFIFFLTLAAYSHENTSGDASFKNTPSCNSPTLLKKITRQFNKKSEKAGSGNLQITQIENVRQTDLNSKSAKFGERRYCAAHIHLSNGTHPTLYYLIKESYGFTGLTSGMNFCVIGHDRVRAHGAKCRSVRKPF